MPSPGEDCTVSSMHLPCKPDGDLGQSVSVMQVMLPMGVTQTRSWPVPSVWQYIPVPHSLSLWHGSQKVLVPVHEPARGTHADALHMNPSAQSASVPQGLVQKLALPMAVHVLPAT